MQNNDEYESGKDKYKFKRYHRRTRSMNWCNFGELIELRANSNSIGIKKQSTFNTLELKSKVWIQPYFYSDVFNTCPTQPHFSNHEFVGLDLVDGVA